MQFADLGLVVVDEQHRFGVEQRAALTDKAGVTPPHVLVMTATPIPRTVAMTVFGDLDVSTLRELPQGRADIQTTVVPVDEHPEWLTRAWQRVREEVEKGHQVYVVCPRIGGDPESAMEEVADEESASRRAPVAVADVAAMLVEGPLADLRVFMLHGRLPADEKDDLMRRFAAGDIDVLVATTVIEVGVDVPNASLMVVMDADRFGVSQLHQLRGRVGRGTVPGLCLLVTDAPDGLAGTSSGSTAWPPRQTGSSSRASTSSTAARATCSGPPSPASGRACACCRCCATRTSSCPRGRPRRTWSTSTRPSSGIPALSARVAALVETEQGRLPGEVVTRIIGGSARGRRLRTPPGNGTRPTADRVREALFSALESELGTIVGTARPRPVRRIGRRRARGTLAGSHVGHARRGRPGDGRRDPARTPRTSAFGQVEVVVARAERWVTHESAGAGLRRRVRRSALPDGHRRRVATCWAGWPAPGGSPPMPWSWSNARVAGAAGSWPVGLEGVREKRYGETMLFLRSRRDDRRQPRHQLGVRECAEPYVRVRSTRSPTDTSTSFGGPPGCSTR